MVDRALLPDGWVKELSEWADARGWTVSLQGRKIYAVPRPLTKSAAVREVARRTGADLTLAAGDSLLDADLLLAADRAGAPATASWPTPAGAPRTWRHWPRPGWPRGGDPAAAHSRRRSLRDLITRLVTNAANTSRRTPSTSFEYVATWPLTSFQFSPSV